VILRRVRTPESTVWPTREMALKYIASPVISAAMNAKSVSNPFCCEAGLSVDGARSQLAPGVHHKVLDAVLKLHALVEVVVAVSRSLRDYFAVVVLRGGSHQRRHHCALCHSGYCRSYGESIPVKDGGRRWQVASRMVSVWLVRPARARSFGGGASGAAAPEAVCRLYAAQQALSWATDPENFASPSATILEAVSPLLWALWETEQVVGLPPFRPSSIRN
jgi:hypothetical protein